jgi:hypothetical protein
MATKPDETQNAKRLMGALLRMPPKPHSQMKVGKSRATPTKSPARKRAAGASAKAKTS